MSRNNLIACIRKKRYYYVVTNVCADTPDTFEDYDSYLRSLITNKSKRTRERAVALVVAHNKQKELNTEYSVHEFDLCDEKKFKSTR